MTYATKDSMKSRYTEDALVELTDRVEPTSGAIVDSVLNAALNAADAQINAYIAKRYDLPLIATPDILRFHAEVLTFYLLLNGHHTDQQRTEYEDTIAFLKSLSRGDAVLDVAGNEPQSAPAEALVSGPARMFNRDTLGGL